MQLNISPSSSNSNNNCTYKFYNNFLNPNSSSSTYDNFFSNNKPLNLPLYSSPHLSILDPNSSKPLCDISSSVISKSQLPSPFSSFSSSSNSFSSSCYYSKFPFHGMINSNLSSNISHSSEFSSSVSSFPFHLSLDSVLSNKSKQTNNLQKSNVNKNNSIDLNDSFISQTKLVHSSVKRKKYGMCQCRECIKLVYFILFDSIE
jgi:hypothetical protein